MGASKGTAQDAMCVLLTSEEGSALNPQRSSNDLAEKLLFQSAHTHLTEPISQPDSRLANNITLQPDAITLQNEALFPAKKPLTSQNFIFQSGNEINCPQSHVYNAL